MRPLLIGLSPNVTDDDRALARCLLDDSDHWFEGEERGKFLRALASFFKTRNVFLFDSGRWSLTVLLKALSLHPGDEVLLQAFTCVVVPNAVRWAGGKPVYVDIGPDLNMDPVDLKKKLSKKSRAIIIQHTFGAPADLKQIAHLAKRHGLLFIEDCAHSLGGSVAGKPLGTFGDAAILSFGRDKVISGVNGGAVVVHHTSLAEDVRAFAQKTVFPQRAWVEQALTHPLLTEQVKRFYALSLLGRALLFWYRMTGRLEPSVFSVEKQGKKPASVGYRLPNALAALALHQWGKLSAMNRKRRAIASAYARNLQETACVHPQRGNEVFLRYPILVDQPDELHAFAKKRVILLGDWYNTPVAPCDTNLAAVGYAPGSCPSAERASSRIVNLPTMPWMTDHDVNRVIQTVRDFYAHH